MMNNFWQRALMAAAVAPLAHGIGITLTVDDSASIKAGAAIAANGLMKLYVNNASADPIKVGTFDKPIYWWEAGAVWGGMIDYWSYTGDDSYVNSTNQALLAQKGPLNDFMNVEWRKELGNDDQVFWGLAAMSAAEQNFPAPVASASTTNPPKTWLELAVNTFNTQIARWDTATCNGGLRWQVYSENSGYTYKNSISNGGLFQLAARLARYTGNQTYVDWAQKTWDWSVGVGLVDATKTYNILDGAGIDQNCSTPDKTQWSYNVAMYLYGAAALYNHTDGADEQWATHTKGLLKNAASVFFGQFSNASNVAFEPACEPYGTCNNDQLSFKAYLARWLAKSTIIAGSLTTDTVMPLLRASAQGAAAACSGSVDGNDNACGYAWDTASYDGKTGVGPQLAAMEVMQALLIAQAPAPATQETATDNGGSGSDTGVSSSSTTTPPVVVQTPTTLLTTTALATSTTAPAVDTTAYPSSTTTTPAASTPINTAAVVSGLLPAFASAAAAAMPADAMF